MTKRVFISCGEYSGERHALGVIKALKQINPSAEIYGMGSKLLQDKINLVADYQAYSFSGLSEVVKNLDKIFELKDLLINKLEEIKPELVLLIDYGGFHLELAKNIKAKFGEQIQIVCFIAPQVWASRPWRINKIKKYISHVLCTLPFEEQIYQAKNIPVTYVGNPVYSSLTPAKSKTDLGVNQDEVLIGLFPGSRQSEIEYMLPLMLSSAELLCKKKPKLKFRFLLAKAPNLDLDIFNKHGFDQQSTVEFLDTQFENTNHALLSASDLLWLCSGTVTLEAAFYETPYFLSYKSTLINYLLYLLLRTTNKAGLANIISGKDIVKEFLQFDATVNNFVSETESMLDPNSETKSFSSYYHQIKNQLKEFNNSFKGYDSYKLVADFISKSLSSNVNN